MGAGSGSGTGELLVGERVLWTGRPGRARVTAADFGFAAYLLAGLGTLTVFGRRELTGLPPLFRAFAVIVLAGAAIQAAGMLVYLTAVKPRLLRGEVYQVTEWRILVTSGLRVRRTWSAYLDQIGQPQVRRNRDSSDDLILSTGPGRPGRRLFAGAFGGGPFSSLGQAAVPVLRSLRDAGHAQQVVAAARQQLPESLAWARPASGLSAGPMPAGVELEPGERVRWAGRPGRVSWWFGAADIYLSAFGLIWLACVSIMGVVTVTGRQAAFLIVLVPFAVVGGLYPAAGRILHRRMRIRRSAYLLTDRRLLASWRIAGEPVTVQARLSQLLPPEIRQNAIFVGQVSPGTPGRSAGWRHMLWPAATTDPPVLAGIADIRSVRDQIAAAQLALRTTGQRIPPPPVAPDPK